MMKRKKNMFGFIFWVVLLSLVILVFFIYKDTMRDVMSNTGFWDIVTKDNTAPEVERTNDDVLPIDQTPTQQTPSTETPAVPQPQIEEKPVVTLLPEIEEEITPTALIEQIPQEGKLRRSVLYFIKVDTEGDIALKGIVRPIYYKDSPLTETLTNLLKGLSASEINQGLLSLIPDGTQLLGVSVKDGTAYINFSEEFLFNSFGKEGYTAQIQQIVYSATEFSTVERVQILIDGGIREYIGSEGGAIGHPLSRENF